MKNNKIIFGSLLVIIVMVAFVWYYAPGSAQKRLCYNEQCFVLEIADTPQLRTQGLMYRTSLAADHGMLFVFPQEDMHHFRMKNTLIPLDMIWMDPSYTILDIQEAVPCTQDPCPLYPAKQKALYVLEIKGGIAKMLGLYSGAQLSLR